MALLRAMTGVRADGNPMDDRYWNVAAPLSLAGVPVSPESAMKISAVWACVRLISQSLASIPLITYKRRSDGGRDRAPYLSLYSLLHDRPNRYMTAFGFKRLMMVHVLLRGNGYAYIRPGPAGPIDHLVPIHPDLVERVELVGEEQLRYHIRQADGSLRPFMDDEIFHLCGLSFDGIRGVSVVEYARESMGLSLAAERYGATHFSQNSVPPAVIKHPGKPGQSAREHILDEWEANTSGLTNAHRAVVLAEGMDIKTLAMSNEDSQFLQTREFQVADIARWFGVPLHMIQEVSGSTSWGSGLEQMSQGFVTFTLLPWAMLWEQTVARDLILSESTYFSEYLFDALVRADFKTRYDAYDIALKDRIMSVNEVRQRENMNPVAGGDFGDAAAAPAAPTPTRQPPGGAEHYHDLLQAVAGRVVRKENNALERAAKRCGDDLNAWNAAVDDFMADHAAFVADVMCVEPATAQGYVDYCRDLLREAGPEGLAAVAVGRLAYLTAMAEE